MNTIARGWGALGDVLTGNVGTPGTYEAGLTKAYNADYALQLKDDLASGRLQRILPDWDMLSWPLFAVYKNEGPPSAAVRAFLDFLEDSCNQVHEDVPAAGKPG